MRIRSWCFAVVAGMVSISSCSSDDVTDSAGGFDLGPFVADPATIGLWHFDEQSGATLGDASLQHNDGTIVGASIVAGIYKNARYFDGSANYVSIPADSSLNLDTSSFTIDVWFKTPGQPGAVLIRRGLAPVPGFMVSLAAGRVVGMIGNREDSSWPDTLLQIWSDGSYGDNRWHCASFVRDRKIRKLLLYVDGNLATKPIDDVFTIPLNNDRPLTFGRWENDMLPYFYNGSLDEVRIKKGVAH